MNTIYQDFMAYRKVAPEELQEVLHRAVETEIEVYASLRAHVGTFKEPLGGAEVGRDAGALLVPLLSRNAQELRLFPDTRVFGYPLALAHSGTRVVLSAPQDITHDRLYVRVEDVEALPDPDPSLVDRLHEAEELVPLLMKLLSIMSPGSASPRAMERVADRGHAFMKATES